jgi:hypothetical protein
MKLGIFPLMLALTIGVLSNSQIVQAGVKATAAKAVGAIGAALAAHETGILAKLAEWRQSFSIQNIMNVRSGTCDLAALEEKAKACQEHVSSVRSIQQPAPGAAAEDLRKNNEMKAEVTKTIREFRERYTPANHTSYACANKAVPLESCLSLLSIELAKLNSGQPMSPNSNTDIPAAPPPMGSRQNPPPIEEERR